MTSFVAMCFAECALFDVEKFYSPVSIQPPVNVAQLEDQMLP